LLEIDLIPPRVADMAIFRLLGESDFADSTCFPLSCSEVIPAVEATLELQSVSKASEKTDARSLRRSPERWRLVSSGDFSTTSPFGTGKGWTFSHCKDLATKQPNKAQVRDRSQLNSYTALER